MSDTAPFPRSVFQAPAAALPMYLVELAGKASDIARDVQGAADGMTGAYEANSRFMLASALMDLRVAREAISLLIEDASAAATHTESLGAPAGRE